MVRPWSPIWVVAAIGHLVDALGRQRRVAAQQLADALDDEVVGAGLGVLALGLAERGCGRRRRRRPLAAVGALSGGPPHGWVAGMVPPQGYPAVTTRAGPPGVGVVTRRPRRPRGRRRGGYRGRRRRCPTPHAGRLAVTGRTSPVSQESRLVHIVDDVPELDGGLRAADDGAGPRRVPRRRATPPRGRPSTSSTSTAAARSWRPSTSTSSTTTGPAGPRCRSSATTTRPTTPRGWWSGCCTTAAARRTSCCSGPEPDNRWEAFARAVREVVERFGVTRVVEHGLGADGGAAHPADRDHPPRQQPRRCSPATARGAASCGSRAAPRRCSRSGWGSGATT